MSLLQPSDLVGQRVVGVTAAWHVFDSERGNDPLYFWLHLEPAGDPVAFRLGSAGQSVGLAAEGVGEPVDMEEYGRIAIESVTSDHILGTLVDQRITAAHWLLDVQWDVADAGVLVCLESGHAVAMANDGDEWEIHAWPSSRLTQLGFAMQQT